MSSTAPVRATGFAFMAALSVLMAFGPISTDMYLPAMPRMAQALGVSPSQVQLTLSSFLIGFGVGQLLWGPLGDRYGRRGPMMAGIALYLIATAGCALGTSLTELIVWRTLQALGASTGPVLARAMVRDTHDREEGARALSTLMLVMAVAPLLAPLLGGQVLLWLDWQAIFWMQAGFGIVALVAVLQLKETLPRDQRATAHPRHVAHAYIEMMTARRFLLPALPGAFFYAGAFSYIAGTPFAFVVYHHVPAELYGLLFAIGICGMSALNAVNRALVPRYGSQRILRAGSIAAAVAGVATAFAAFTGYGGLTGLAVPVLAYVSMLGLISANALAGAMANYPQRAGAASALAGAMQFGFGALATTLLTALADGTPWPMGMMIGLSGAAACISALLLRGKTDAPTAEAPRVAKRPAPVNR